VFLPWSVRAKGLIGDSDDALKYEQGDAEKYLCLCVRFILTAAQADCLERIAHAHLLLER